MNELVEFAVPRLGIAALVLSVLYPLVWILLRRIPNGPALVHRIAWSGVLLVPLFALSVPVSLPVLEPEDELVFAGSLQGKSVPVQPYFYEKALEYETETDGSPAAEPAFSTTEEARQARERLRQNEASVSDAPVFKKTDEKASSWNFRKFLFPGLFVVWLSGVGVFLGHRVFLHFKLLRHLKNVKPLDAESQKQWMDILRENKVPPFNIPVYLTEATGPALVRSGFRRILLLPETLWDELPEALRPGVLRHELAHYLHGDNVLSPAVHFLAVLQWFHPLAWFALRKYNTAVEWHCDDFAYRKITCRTGSGSADLAETFLTIHRSTESLGLYLNTFSRFGTLDRVRRLAYYESHEKESPMKKTLLVSLLVLLLLAGLFRVELVAKPPADSPKSPTQVEKKTPAPRIKMPDLGPELDPKQVPKIVKMFPENNATKVDPNISQVYITFDIPMGSGRAWAHRNDGTQLDHDPDGPVFWTEDQLTSVAPVKLQPNKKYAVYLNIRPFIGFASLSGVPSEAVVYRFETGDGPLDEKKRTELAKKNFKQPEAAEAKRAWSPEQATGKPDAYRFKTGGDYMLAWASETTDEQEEWLELTWDEPRETIGVLVYETFNPGALVRVIAYSVDEIGQALDIARWEGKDPTPRNTPKGKGISRIMFKNPVETRKIRLFLDSPNVPGWNEIDAVGLVDSKGEVHWATGATASSTYADAGNRSVKKIHETRVAKEDEDEETVRNWAPEEQQEKVREALRKYKDANSRWFYGVQDDDVQSLSYRFNMDGAKPEDVSWEDIKKASNWYYEFYRKGISYIGVSRLLVSDIDALRCTRVEEDAEKGTLTFDFVLKQPWMNAVGNGIAGSWKGWFNGVVGEGTAVLDTKTNTILEIRTENYDERFSDYVEIEKGKFVPGRIVVDYHKGKRGGESDMFFDFRFKVYEGGVWLFDRSLPQEIESKAKPVVWIDEVKIDGKEAVERKP